MEKFKGTKDKEWIVSQGNYVAVEDESFAICKLFNNTFINNKQMKANAKLIAQSPNMLDVLNEVEDYLLSSQPEWMEGEEMLYNRIRSVILKATE